MPTISVLNRKLWVLFLENAYLPYPSIAFNQKIMQADDVLANYKQLSLVDFLQDKTQVRSDKCHRR